MDLDAYVEAHGAEWARLKQLSSARRLDAAESDELLDLYQRTATHLSHIRSTAPDPTVTQYLSTILAKARARAMGTRTGSWTVFATFFVETFPAMLYRSRRWWLTTMGVNIVVAVLLAWWVADHPGVQTSMLSPEAIDNLVNHEFEGYYHESSNSEFAARVWTNNAWVAAVCLAGGALGLPVIYMLWQNISNLGIIGGLMADHDRLGLFFGLILPHGLLELTAVFVAAGAGLRMFWSWVEPGDRSRASHFAREARASMTLALGLIVVLLVSGLIEGFVTPSNLPTWARIAIGVVAELLFFIYVWTLGRSAVARGVTGDVTGADATAEAPARG
ncbi:stage II sporulation protein M [Calidifontibacter indicus]|uniref:Putative membrane protein SpoIIM required for sporulation n=1 Tax=Calidifontibacter indicus TaxID=419650 RepID=A0A3D9UUW2_9MICO|nr:stage II sporulation protein M [Calidifontibacter indicus]REF30405.1 putative membrane protein SpoIIM required for sporulation [Calidifontibacter indicus]